MTWTPPAPPPRLFYAIPVGASRRRAFFTRSQSAPAAPPRLLYARPVRRLFLRGVAVQAVEMGRIDAEDLHLVGEERKVLQRPRHVAVPGVALHVGMEPGGDEVPPLERGTPV